MARGFHMRPATDKEKYFVYKTQQLMTESNKPKIEGIVKAFGLIRDVDTSLTESDKAKFESIDALEAMRGDQEPKAFLESVAVQSLKDADPAKVNDVRKSINYYRNWISK